MTGFVIFLGNLHGLKHELSIKVPVSIRTTICRNQINHLTSFISWGAELGDIHFSWDKESSTLLVLNGYIVESGLVKVSRHQHENAESILRYVARDHSFESLADLADSLNGSFSIVYVKSDEKKVYCVTDRIASRPLWVCEDSALSVVSSNANTIGLLHNKIHYDLGGLCSFLLYGGPVDPCRTIYKGVRAVEPGTIYVGSASGTYQSKRWYQYLYRPESRSSEDWIDLTAQRLRKAVRRLAPHCNRPLIFLSGGVDSRLAASAFRAEGYKPLLVTLCDRENLEVRIAKKVARSLQCNHLVLKRDPHWYLRPLENLVYQSGGTFLWRHGHFSEAYRTLKADHTIDVALLGDFCEAFSKLCSTVDPKRKELWTPEEFAREFDGLHLPSYRPQNREITLNFLTPSARHEGQAQLKQAIINRYLSICKVADDPKIVADQFLRWNSAATIATFSMFFDLRSVGPERSLMFDKDVLELIELLPSSLRDGANFGARLIEKLWPPAGTVLNSNTLVPITWHPMFHTATKSIRPFFGRTYRYLFGGSYSTQGSWQEHRFLYLNDQGWRRFLEGILRQEELFDEELFDRKAIGMCWDSFCSGNQHLSSDLEKLLQIGVLALYARGSI